MASLKRLAALGGGVQADPQFNLTTLLLHGDGTNGAQNNTFLDSSSNNFTITRTGNSTQGTFTPFSLSDGMWSAYVNAVFGSSTFTSRTLFNGNSTIELFVFPSTLSGQKTFVVGGGLNFGTNGSKLRIDDGVNASSVFESTGTISANTWTHVAVVRSGNTFSFYINGVFDSSNSSLASFYTSNATSINVGAFNSGGTNFYTGYMSNVRVSNIARTITLPNAPYSSDANTIWLIFQSRRFVDNGNFSYSLSFVGTPSVQAFSPFVPTSAYSTSVVGGSGYFDGTGDFLTTPNNTVFQILSGGNYTVEAWVYLNVTTTGQVLCALSNSTGLNGYDFRFDSLKPTIVYPGSAATSGPTALNINSWNHVAFMRSGTQHYVALNGVVSAISLANRTADNTTDTFKVATDSPAGSIPLNGYITGLRVIKGQALSITNFTPPTSPVNSTQIGWNQSTAAITGTTAIVLNATNAGIIDNTSKNDLETVGNAQISTAVKKFNTGSLAFDGTGDWLTFPNSAITQVGSGNFTIEGWVYVNAIGVAYGLISKGTATTGWSVNITSGNKLQFSYTATALTGATSLAANTWYYFAVVRSGTATGNLKIYLDGSVDATSAGAVTDNFNQTNIGYIGASRTATTALNGYLDDLRITLAARTITTPTAAFPDQ